MKKTHIAAAVLVAFGCLLKTQTVRAAGYEFEGVGARRVGAGGAAIADSDDWTAIYWNPANIVRAAQGGHKDIGVELFAGEVYGHDSNSLSGLPGQTFRFEKDDLHSNFILGAIGAAIPIGQKAAVGFGFYTPLLQGAKFQAVQDASPRTDLDFDGSATILTWNVSGSYQFTPRFSAGAGLNLLYGRFSSNINIKNYAMAGDNLNSTLNGNGLGLEGTFGLRYDVCDKFSVGGVFRSGNDVKIKGGASADYTSAFPVPGVTSNSHSDFTYPLRHPATWGLGTSYHPNEKLTLLLDYNRTLWSRFISNIVYDTPSTFQPNLGNSFDWNDSWKIRLGARYKTSDKNEIFGGYAYDVPALDERSIDFSTTVDVYMNRFSVGMAHEWSERFETSVGILAGYGERTVGNVEYRLTGYQIMVENRFGSAH